MQRAFELRLCAGKRLQHALPSEPRPKPVHEVNMRSVLPVRVTDIGVSLIEIEKVPSARLWTKEHVPVEQAPVLEDLRDLSKSLGDIRWHRANLRLPHSLVILIGRDQMPGHVLAVVAQMVEWLAVRFAAQDQG